MLFQGTVVALMLLLVAGCVWMLFKVYGSRPATSPVGLRPPAVSAARGFPDILTGLLDERLRKVPDAAMRFALQSRIDAAIRMEDAGRCLALLEVFFDLERLEPETWKPEAAAQLGDGNHPGVALLTQPSTRWEPMIARQLTDQLRRGLTSVVGAKRAALDFQDAGPLPVRDEGWVRWYYDGHAQAWFSRLAAQAEDGIGSDNVVRLIDSAAREIGQTVPLVSFPNLFAMLPAECLTAEKSYAAGRSALWNDFLHTRRSLQASEDGLRRLNEELEQRVRDRTAELEAARACAEESERAKDRFLANMSHEVRTPLHGVIGMLDLLRASGLSAAQAEHAAVMHRSSIALRDVVNDILDLSKIQRAGLTLESKEYSPADIAADTVSLFRPTAQTKSVEMHLVVEQVPPRITGDPSRMRQVLGNLVGNAVKFTGSGTITLSLRGDTDRGRLRVEVADSGMGIPETEIQRIFDPFAQANHSRRPQLGGTGLGLTISAELVKLMGGQLTVHSVLGKGSTFAFEIPMKAVEGVAAPAHTETAADYAALPMFPVDVLLAEDNPANQLLAKAQLATLGCRVQLAVNGAEALHLYGQGRYDIVLMDCQMPELDGYEASVAIRALERERGTARVPIVAVTATVTESERDLCREAGMDDFLSKPYGVPELAALLERWLPTPERAEETTGAPSGPADLRPAAAGACSSGTFTHSRMTAIASGPVLEKEILDQLRGLDARQPPELAARVLGVFLQDTSRQLIALREAIGHRDGRAAYRAAHSMQGGAAMMGVASMAEHCRQLAEAARAESFDRCEALATELDAGFQAVQRAVAAQQHSFPTTH